MTNTYLGHRYIIIDDFLDSDTLRLLREYEVGVQFNRVHSIVDSSNDGVAFCGGGGSLRDIDMPQGHGLNKALRSLNAAIVAHPEIYGVSANDWVVMSFAFWQYPVGSRLGWHNDAGRGRTGGFILYLHDEWRPSWGGELIVLDEPKPMDFADVSVTDLSAAIEDAVARSSALLTAISPRPNRLVMVKAGTCHYINRVDKAAASVTRCSLAGFTSQSLAGADIHNRQSNLDRLLKLAGADTPAKSTMKELIP